MKWYCENPWWHEEKGGRGKEEGEKNLLSRYVGT